MLNSQGKMQKRQPSLIERMGGAEAASGFLISAVELLYHKLVTDPDLERFFRGKDIEMLKRKQVDFLAYVFGGPAGYNGKGIYEAHEHLIREQGELNLYQLSPYALSCVHISSPYPNTAGLNQSHFDIVATHFRDTMIELGAAPELISEALGILLTARHYFIKVESEPTSDNDSSGHGGAENIAVVAGQVQELLLSSDAQVEKTKEDVRRLTSGVKPASLELLRSALRMRGPGLVELLDQTLQEVTTGK